MQDEAAKSYQPLQRTAKTGSVVTVSDLLAARDSLLSIEKTNSNRAGAETHINKVIMGDVSITYRYITHSETFNIANSAVL